VTDMYAVTFSKESNCIKNKIQKTNCIQNSLKKKYFIDVGQF